MRYEARTLIAINHVSRTAIEGIDADQAKIVGIGNFFHEFPVSSSRCLSAFSRRFLRSSSASFLRLSITFWIFLLPWPGLGGERLVVLCDEPLHLIAI